MISEPDIGTNTFSTLSSSFSSTCNRRRSRSARELLRRHLIQTWQDTQRLQQHHVVTTTTDHLLHSTNHNNNNNNYNIDVSEWNIWQLLDATIAPRFNDDTRSGDHDTAATTILPERQVVVECPLLPKYDIYREQEESYTIRLDRNTVLKPKSTRLSAIPGILHHQRSLRSSSRSGGSGSTNHQYTPSTSYDPYVYHCTVCSKHFISQYYLDQHFDRKHPIMRVTNNNNNNNSNKNSNWICPADTFCAFLSPLLCDDHTLQYEPYYEPSAVTATTSAGNSSSSSFTSASKSKSTTPPQQERRCNEQDQQLAIIKCHDVIALCFDTSSTFGQILSTNMCSTVPTSCNRFVHATTVDGDGMNTISVTVVYNLVHYWYDKWRYLYDDHHTTSTWITMLVVTCIFILVYGHYIYQMILGFIQQRQQQQQPRNRQPHHPYSHRNNKNNNSNRYDAATVSRSNRSLNSAVVRPPTTYIVPTMPSSIKAKLK